MQYYLRNDYYPRTKRYSYPIRNFVGIDALSDENTMPLTYCSYGYNIGFRNGALINGMGIDYAKIKDKTLPHVGLIGKRIIKSWIYYKYNYTQNQREDMIVALLDDNTVYVTLLDGGTAFEQTTMSFDGGTASALNYHHNGEDVFLIFGSEGGMYMFDGQNAEYYSETPGFLSVCLHYDRVYGVTASGHNRVYFSDDLNPVNWRVSMDQGGYISFPDEGGRAQKVVSFNDYVFIFREYAIHRLTAYTDLTEYKLTKTFSTNNKIYPDTVQICSDKIVFLAEDGLYAFDGFIARKIYSKLFPLIDKKEWSVACYFDYKYYLATTLKNLDNSVVGDEALGPMKNNAIIAIDFDLGNVSILRGGDIRCFMPINTSDYCELIVAFNNYRCSYFGMISDSGKLIDMPLQKLWRSPATDLSQSDGNKVLRRIYLTAHQTMSLTVKGEESIEKRIYSSPYIQIIPVNFGAEKLALDITTENNKLYLNGMLLEFDIVRRRYK
ncbi:MAG: hypothetical protein QM214_01640 [Bacillota bacterium]|jgi:hypothetical protein|nr:hypothetical protein [Bacillota bacterium]HHU43801.1 hypothetical protein [Clostridiales bacterium]